MVDVDRSHVNTDSQVLDACAAIAQVIGTPTAIAKSTSGVGRHMLYRVPSHTKAQSQGRAPKALHQYGEVFYNTAFVVITEPDVWLTAATSSTIHDFHDLRDKLLRALPRPQTTPSKTSYPATPAEMAAWPAGGRNDALNCLRLPGDPSINTGMEWAGRVEARAPTRFLWWTLHRTRAAAVAALLPCRSRKRGTA